MTQGFSHFLVVHPSPKKFLYPPLKIILNRLCQWPQRKKKTDKATTSNSTSLVNWNKNYSLCPSSALEQRNGTKYESEPSTRLKEKKNILSVAKSISFIVCLFCPIFDAETSWSSWRTCVQSNGNLCRCQTRRCEEKGNTLCLTDVEVRLENCTGKLICSLTVVITCFSRKYSRCLLENALY